MGARPHEQAVAADLVLEEVRTQVPQSVWPLIELYLRRPAEPLTVASAAKQLGVDRKTLLNRMQAVHCPSPAEMRAWCRLFVAARLLERSGRTVESVAQQLEFQSGSALRNMLKRYTGLAPNALRAEGALHLLMNAFHRARAGKANRSSGGRRKQAPRRAQVAEPPPYQSE